MKLKQSGSGRIDGHTTNALHCHMVFERSRYQGYILNHTNMIRCSHPVLFQIVKTPHSYVEPNKPVHNHMLHLIEAALNTSSNSRRSHPRTSFLNKKKNPILEYNHPIPVRSAESQADIDCGCGSMIFFALSCAPVCEGFATPIHAPSTGDPF
jgi:hypothetical protein